MSDELPTAWILSQGDEIVTGQTVDTNAAWLAQELLVLGFEVTRHTTVGDRLDALVEQLREISGRADVCLCTGGLGPTIDDLTAEAVAQAFDRPLALDESALSAIEAWYERRGTSMPEPNRKQALLPRGAERLDNLWGTAPGFALTQGCCRFYFLPGVPWEMRAMFRQSVRSELPILFDTRPDHLIVLRTVGIGESVLQAQMNAIALPDEARLGFCVVDSEVQVKLRLPAGFDAVRLSELVLGVRQKLGDAVFSVEGWYEPGGDLASVIDRLLGRLRHRLVLAETLSAGVLANQCAPMRALLEARVYPTAGALYRAFTLDTSAASELLAKESAARLRQATGADYALVQLPEVSENPAVLVALATPRITITATRTLAHESERRRYQAAAFTLDLLRRHLLGSA